ncbi:short-chain dehydrogenase [Rhodococcus sp. ACPA4]|uniref:NAD(P)-dependent dehydrogenase (Short-subunit alcohol dehydrogenase family) n=1 Tax=Nocardia globerula TaxID=1818 RepID=A0A652YI55_NOCGL|nr:MULTISPECIES: SDR family oxidoreductase [Rhodococcus]NMD64420.1 SDR family oxidoreductase [Nocardia globerula]MCE4268721.1 SDR family oxidoreductase [Rhodococcus globerulus]MDV8071437.1 SDR family oxidoreductase [Rhodococcus sp. IEGM 1366]PBC42920.1 short-chain dehydrogenase [Rhodococcus sp. ACPA4]PVX63410.1 NAD(P)-dependent dehydrogenase (short-subunit alcohol dehydrogenase family) [Rhodococcus globerulus]
MDLSLENRRVLITGAATGIGAAAVQVLAASGARVVGTFHNTEPDTESAATWIRCDVTDQSSVQQAVAKAVAALGGLDVLIHAAGSWQLGAPGHIDAENIRTMIDVNFSSTVFANQAAYEVMKESGGQIINFGSSEGVSGSPVSATYAAAKAAVHSWTRSVAKMWGADGVTVNALAPAVQTPGADRRLGTMSPEAIKQYEQQLKMVIPLGGKLGNPVSDLGPVLAFLSSDAAKFITGQLLAVDGGLMMIG